jgi:predicted  nucleic acid-binding Zn-ribbon protein
MLNRIISDKVIQYQMKLQYEDRVSEYSELMRSMVSEVRSLEDLRKQLDENKNDEKLSATIEDHEQSIEDLEIKLELVGAELEDLRAKLTGVEDEDEDGPELSKYAGSAKTAIGNLDAPIVRTLLWNFVEQLAKSKVRSQAQGASTPLLANPVSLFSSLLLLSLSRKTSQGRLNARSLPSKALKMKWIF